MCIRDRATEAAAHLAKLTTNEKELSDWTNICTGVYATFGDSVPIEGLTEAANETAKTGSCLLYTSGESNAALRPTMQLIHPQNQGIINGVKNSASIRFLAKVANLSLIHIWVKRRIFSGVVCEQEVYTVSDRANIKKAEPRPRFNDDEERAPVSYTHLDRNRRS